MEFIRHIRRFVLMGFVILYVANAFIHQPVLDAAGYILLLLIVVWAAPELPRANMAVSGGLFAVGAAILFFIGAPPQRWLEAMARNSGLIALFISVPLIGVPFFFDDYQGELKNVLIRHVRSAWGFSLLAGLVVHLSGAFLLVGGIISTYQLFRENARLFVSEEEFVVALTRGYMTNGFWSPAWASMAVVAGVLHIPWSTVAPVGVPIAICLLAISFILERLTGRSGPGMPPVPPAAGVIVNWRKVYTMAGLLMGPIIMIMAVERTTAWKLTVIIPMVACACPLLAAAVLRKFKALRAGISRYYNTTILNSRNEAVLFAAAGFLGGALEFAGAGEVIPGLLPAAITGQPFFLIATLIGIMALVSLPGIHPVVSGSALAGAITPAAVGLTTYAFGMTLVSGWAVAIMVSPFSAASLTSAGLSGIPSWDIGLKLNGLFGIVATLFLAGVISVFFL